MLKKIHLFFAVLMMELLFLPAYAKEIVVNYGDNLNEIINAANGGDRVIVNPGSYAKISISNKRFSEETPLVIVSDGTGLVKIMGDTITDGSALEINNCSYIAVEGLFFTKAMWGIYVKNSEHIILENNEIQSTGQEGCHIGRSSRFVDIIGNKIHNTGLYRSKWAEGIYIGSGSYGRNNFPDNCEFIWIEDNQIYETGNAEGINVKGECFHVTVKNNRIHDISPGTVEQYNQAAITVEGGENSIKNDFRLSEMRDVWIENNVIDNVSGGHSDWNNGIMFFGTGVYILNNIISNCANKGIYGNNWKNLGLKNFVSGNVISGCNENLIVHPELRISDDNPGKNPHSPQKWYSNH